MTIAFLLIFSLTLPALASENYRVARVIDGDTIELSTGERVRYIGIDLDETDETLGMVMKEYNRRLVEGKNVRLEFDKDRHDKYGRLLAYVYVDDLFVNALLVKQGLARVMTVKPNVRYKDYFKQLELEAKKARRGIWSK